MTSRILYAALVLAVAVERLAELRLSRRHVAAALAAGGVEVGAAHYPWMVALHSCFLLSCVAEVWLLERPLLPLLALGAGCVLAAATLLRAWVIATLGERWTTRVVWAPGRRLAQTGPYRWLRHPNYLAVILEIAALPLVHGAWLTAGIFSCANLILLRVRVRTEETFLAARASAGSRT